MPCKAIAAAVIVALFLLPPAAALTLTSLDVIVPSSIEVGGQFTLTAHYRDNESEAICGAFCTANSVAWLSGQLFDSGCQYSASFTGPPYSGSQTIDVVCSKSGYYTGYKSAPVSVNKKPAYARIESYEEAHAGEKFTVRTYLTDSGGNYFVGKCYSYIYSGGLQLSQYYMAQVGNSHVAEMTAPSNEGTYAVKVRCTHDQYADVWAESPLNVIKKPSVLLIEEDGSYYGGGLSVRAFYRSAGGYSIRGRCSAALKIAGSGSQKEMTYTGSSYEASFSVPFDRRAMSIEVSCLSNDYAPQASAKNFQPQPRPAGISSDLKKVYYATEAIQMNAIYADSMTTTRVSGATCTASAGASKITLSETSGAYAGKFGQLMPGAYTLEIKCSGEFYAGSSFFQAFEVRPVGLVIKSAKKIMEYQKGENISMEIVVMDQFSAAANTSCSAAFDFYDGSIGGIYRSSKTNATRNGAYYTVFTAGTDRPSRIRATVSCGGGAYEKKYELFEAKVGMLSGNTRDMLIMSMTGATALLLGLFFLLKKRLKNIL
jgi:hypothetical protein